MHLAVRRADNLPKNDVRSNRPPSASQRAANISIVTSSAPERLPICSAILISAKNIRQNHKKVLGTQKPCTARFCQFPAAISKRKTKTIKITVSSLKKSQYSMKSLQKRIRQYQQKQLDTTSRHVELERNRKKY